MSKIGRFSTLGYALIATQLLCLSACTMVKPATDHTTQSTPTKAAAPAKPAGADADSATVLNEHRVIVPSAEIVKDGLQVSYSIKTVADGADNLLQLSLVFRNTNSKSVVVTPKVSLTDAKGVALPAYTKKAFEKVAANLLSKSKRSKQDQGEIDLLREQLDWDKAFWLPARFKIPEGGIQIGGLVFHHDQLVYPLALQVESEDKQFQFTIKDPAAAVAVKKPEEKKSADCGHSPALGTALYVGSKNKCR